MYVNKSIAIASHCLFLSIRALTILSNTFYEISFAQLESDTNLAICYRHEVGQPYKRTASKVIREFIALVHDFTADAAAACGNQNQNKRCNLYVQKQSFQSSTI